jgi:methoxymalonate biosynthesis protein
MSPNSCGWLNYMGAHCGDKPIGELVTSTSVHGAAEVTTVIEPITEAVELKSKVLVELSAVVRPGAPLVSKYIVNPDR